MTHLHNPLTAGAADEYVNTIVASLDAGDDAAALETALRAFDSDASGDVVKQRLAQAIQKTLNTKVLSSGQVTVVMTFAGTGYAKRDRIPVVGDGEGAEITVTEVGGSGEITAYEMVGGMGYFAAAASDSTGVGGEDATFTTTIDNKAGELAIAGAAIDAA